MRLLTSLAHHYWMLVSPRYRQHWRAMNTVGETPGTTIETLVGGQILHGVHNRAHCADHACPVHTPSDHHMAGWAQNWRSDRKLMERICPWHGIGHPDPDHMAYLLSKVGPSVAAGAAVHACDGCCQQRFSLQQVADEFGVDLDD